MIGDRSMAAGVLALLIAGASACTPSYEALEVDWIQGPVAAEVSSGELSVPEGRLVVFSAKPGSSRIRDYDATHALELVSESPTVARVEQGLAVGTWMIMGVSQGRTVLEVRVDGELEDRIPIDVIAQEVSP